MTPVQRVASPSCKQPYYFTASDGSALSIAGFWDEWRDRESGEKLKSCTIIVCDASLNFVGEVHDRMPILLEPRDFDGWLSAGRAGGAEGSRERRAPEMACLQAREQRASAG